MVGDPLMLVSVSCPVCKADLGSAPQDLRAVVGPVLVEMHQCRLKVRDGAPI